MYETTVSPGEFLINDLYPTGYGGDLNVTVRESDGTEQTFSVPYASVVQLLRLGSSRYAITGGEVRNDSLRDKPSLYQATYQRGLTNAITGYGGVQDNEHYSALQVGAAVGTPSGRWHLMPPRRARNWIVTLIRKAVIKRGIPLMGKAIA